MFMENVLFTHYKFYWIVRIINSGTIKTTAQLSLVSNYREKMNI